MANGLQDMNESADQCSMVVTPKRDEPQGDLEHTIVQLWKEVFQIDRIGRNDNFFELGGNSLIGMNLSEMFSIRLNLDIPIITIFQHPTIREVAQIIGGFDEIQGT